MAVTFKPLFKMSNIHKDIQRHLRAADKALFEAMKDAGLAFAKAARMRSEFQDQTGNLRSSIGCIILKDGVVKYKNFVLSNKGTDKTTGLKKGREVGLETAIEFAQDNGLREGYVLVVVAGMHYAAAVESKNYDVLTNSASEGENELLKGLIAIKKQFQR